MRMIRTACLALLLAFPAASPARAQLPERGTKAIPGGPWTDPRGTRDARRPRSPLDWRRFFGGGWLGLFAASDVASTSAETFDLVTRVDGPVRTTFATEGAGSAAARRSPTCASTPGNGAC